MWACIKLRVQDHSTLWFNHFLFLWLPWRSICSRSKVNVTLFIYFFWLRHMTCGIRFPTRDHTYAPYQTYAVEVRILNHWATREVSNSYIHSFNPFPSIWNTYLKLLWVRHYFRPWEYKGELDVLIWSFMEFLKHCNKGNGKQVHIGRIKAFIGLDMNFYFFNRTGLCPRQCCGQ